MQILQVNLGDYIPRYQIVVLVQHWMEPTTIWDGRPVIGFMADSYLDDLKTVGSSTSIPCGHFQPQPSTGIGNQWPLGI